MPKKVFVLSYNKVIQNEERKEKQACLICHGFFIPSIRE